jgi:Zn-dependent M28 family amino/carboxypeptidase
MSCATNIPSVAIPDIQETKNDITIDDFKAHITYLSSDGLAGRSSGTPGDRLAKDYIVNHFTNAGGSAERFVEVQEHYVSKSRLKPKNKVKTYNIIATLPGNDKKLKNEYVVIGAHYDSVKNTLGLIHNGADDNGSGTSMVLELFEKFASENNHKRTLVFMAFGGEELGLLGSKHYVNNPTIDLSKVQLMVNLDMVGRMDEENNVQLGGSPSAKNFSSKLHPFFVNSKINIIDLGKGIFSRSDHYNFYKKDIPVLFFFTGIHPDYHTATDDEDKINYDGMMEISKVVEPIIAEFANVEERLVFETMEEEEQEKMQSPSKMKVTLGIMPDYAFDDKGVKADSVIDNRPGQKAGMIDGDIVIKIKDFDIVDMYKYMEALSKIESGAKTQITVLRDKEEIVLDVQF